MLVLDRSRNQANPGTVAILTVANLGDVAQLAEHLLCKQGVVGSIPIVSTTIYQGKRTVWVGAASGPCL